VGREDLREESRPTAAGPDNEQQASVCHLRSL
jgi:hypothetical protein